MLYGRCPLQQACPDAGCKQCMCAAPSLSVSKMGARVRVRDTDMHVHLLHRQCGPTGACADEDGVELAVHRTANQQRAPGIRTSRPTARGHQNSRTPLLTHHTGRGGALGCKVYWYVPHDQIPSMAMCMCMHAKRAGTVHRCTGPAGSHDDWELMVNRNTSSTSWSRCHRSSSGRQLPEHVLMRLGTD